MKKNTVLEHFGKCFYLPIKCQKSKKSVSKLLRLFYTYIGFAFNVLNVIWLVLSTLPKQLGFGSALEMLFHS